MQVNWTNFLNWIVERAKEPSTYAGIGLVLASANVHIDPSLGASLVNFGMAAAGVASIVKSEGKL
jgi:hypothetical protein